MRRETGDVRKRRPLLTHVARYNQFSSPRPLSTRKASERPKI